MRLFASIFIKNDIASEIFKYSKPLCENFLSKPVLPENMHITLNFFGNEDINKCIEILGQATSGINEFEIEIKKIKYFSQKKYANILWAGIEDENLILAELAKKTGNTAKDYIAHITLSRFKRNAPRNDILDKYIDEKQLKDINFGKMKVAKISLVESILYVDGAKYKILKNFNL